MTSDQLYAAKVAIFVIGGAVGVTGMVTGRAWLVNTAIGILALGVVLRLITRRRPL